MALCPTVRIHAVPVYHKSIVNIFRNKVRGHGEKKDGVAVPAGFFRQRIAPPGGERREDAVEQKNLHHGFGHIIRGFEGEFSVQREVPQHREYQGNQVAGPVFPRGHHVQYRKSGGFNNSRRCGEQGELNNLNPCFPCIGFVRFVHRVFVHIGPLSAETA